MTAEAYKTKWCLDKIGSVDEGQLSCKNCKHSQSYYHGTDSNLGMLTYFCFKVGYSVMGNGYCRYAEKEEE